MESQRTVQQTREPDQRSDAFRGFGSSILANCARRPLQHIVFPKDLPAARAKVRKHIPVCPGVYGWLNPDDTLIYVGKSKSLRHRLTSYFATETTDPKMSRIRRNSRTLVWEPVSHELLSLIRETELINRWRPSFNVQGKPERQQPGFICVSKGSAPTLFFSRQVPRRAAEAIGPIAGRARLSEAIVCLNYVFQLRDCPDKIKVHFNNQLQLFGNDRTPQCIRHELETCLAPCAGYCSLQAYRHNLDKALKFLRGRDKNSIKRLEERMQHAAMQLSFERACVLRDHLSQMKWLQRRLSQLATARRKLNGIWKLPGFDRLEHWMILRAGQLHSCTNGELDPTTNPQIESATSSADKVPQTHLQINLTMLLSSWIRKHPDHLKTLTPFDSSRDSADDRADRSQRQSA